VRKEKGSHVGNSTGWGEKEKQKAGESHVENKKKTRRGGGADLQFDRQSGE